VEDFACPTPEHFLFGTVRVRAVCRDTGRPLEAVLVGHLVCLLPFIHYPLA
jgi:hypothetical protein